MCGPKTRSLSLYLCCVCVCVCVLYSPLRQPPPPPTTTTIVAAGTGKGLGSTTIWRALVHITRIQGCFFYQTPWRGSITRFFPRITLFSLPPHAAIAGKPKIESDGPRFHGRMVHGCKQWLSILEQSPRIVGLKWFFVSRRSLISNHMMNMNFNLKAIIPSKSILDLVVLNFHGSDPF